MKTIYFLILIFSIYFVDVEADVQYLARQVRVGVFGGYEEEGFCIDGDQFDQILSQLSTTPYWSSVTAEFVTNAQINTPTALANFDVVILMPSGYLPSSLNNIESQTAQALVTWVNGGGAVVSGADISFMLNDSSLVSIIQPIIPVKLADSKAVRCLFSPTPAGPKSATWTITNMSHPVTDAVFFSNTWSSYSYNSFSTKLYGTTLAYTNGSTCSNVNATGDALIVMEYGQGRSVFISLAYCGEITFNAESLRQDPASKLLANAVVWASQIATVPPPSPTPPPTATVPTNDASKNSISNISLVLFLLFGFLFFGSIL